MTGTLSKEGRIDGSALTNLKPAKDNRGSGVAIPLDPPAHPRKLLDFGGFSRLRPVYSLTRRPARCPGSPPSRVRSGERDTDQPHDSDECAPQRETGSHGDHQPVKSMRGTDVGTPFCVGEGNASRTERIPCRGIQFLVHRFAPCVPPVERAPRRSRVLPGSLETAGLRSGRAHRCEIVRHVVKRREWCRLERVEFDVRNLRMKTRRD